MAKVTLVQMVYNGMRYIPDSVASMINQTYKDIEVVCVINGNDDHGKEYIEEHFPSVRIIDPGENLKFVKGHNLVFSQIDTEFFQLVNQDLILEPNYVEEVLKVFDDSKVGGANGKIYQYDWEHRQKSKKLDTTGIVLGKSGGARSRGQNQVDTWQFDNQTNLIAVDGAACIYRKSALEAVRMPRFNLSRHPTGDTLSSSGESNKEESFEYFDVDFHMYWEDVDLSLRMVNQGYEFRFVPMAVGYHGRTASSSPGGYKKVFAFIKHHKKIAPWIRQSNYKNHIFLIVKNFPKFYLKFFGRELFYQIYVLFLETSTLKVLPTFFRQLPIIRRKRKYIQQHRKISAEVFEKLLT